MSMDAVRSRGSIDSETMHDTDKNRRSKATISARLQTCDQIDGTDKTRGEDELERRGITHGPGGQACDRIVALRDDLL